MVELWQPNRWRKQESTVFPVRIMSLVCPCAVAIAGLMHLTAKTSPVSSCNFRRPFRRLAGFALQYWKYHFVQQRCHSRELPRAACKYTKKKQKIQKKQTPIKIKEYANCMILLLFALSKTYLIFSRFCEFQISALFCAASLRDIFCTFSLMNVGCIINIVPKPTVISCYLSFI